jgi:hypothetical protein
VTIGTAVSSGSIVVSPRLFVVCTFMKLILGAIDEGTSTRSGGSDRRYRPERLRKLGYWLGQRESPPPVVVEEPAPAPVQVTTFRAIDKHGPLLVSRDQVERTCVDIAALNRGWAGGVL